jgi:hypothetical protein
LPARAARWPPAFDHIIGVTVAGCAESSTGKLAPAVLIGWAASAAGSSLAQATRAWTDRSAATGIEFVLVAAVVVEVLAAPLPPDPPPQADTAPAQSKTIAADRTVKEIVSMMGLR